LTTCVKVWYFRAYHARWRWMYRLPMILERWLSGRKRRFAKPLDWETGLGGSNPPLSAEKKAKTRGKALEIGLSRISFPPSNGPDDRPLSATPIACRPVSYPTLFPTVIPR
jgi:hypothetical protein